MERYQAVVYSGARRTAQSCQILLEQSDLEDITAEVFASIVANDYAALRRFEGRSRLSTWLTVLARRHCLLRCRIRQVRLGPLVMLERTGQRVRNASVQP